jgi:hypothetical protein
MRSMRRINRVSLDRLPEVPTAECRALWTLPVTFRTSALARGPVRWREKRSSVVAAFRCSDVDSNGAVTSTTPGEVDSARRRSTPIASGE